jgi:hypothetical protein
MLIALMELELRERNTGLDISTDLTIVCNTMVKEVSSKLKDLIFMRDIIVEWMFT